VNASGFEAGEDRPAGLRTVFEPAPKCADLNHSRSADIGRKTRQLEFVVKLSKYCNLRCSYCYEFEDLHKKDRMNLGSGPVKFVADQMIG
jgi:sulfatase maturation enzyme AslB (radical SAM superfamily)